MISILTLFYLHKIIFCFQKWKTTNRCTAVSRDGKEVHSLQIIKHEMHYERQVLSGSEQDVTDFDLFTMSTGTSNNYRRDQF
jgi:hypothetical protein